jgi:NAD(P)-dependent dehydrogenase (short-subunit alcohol dehydrogenase family)
MPTAGSLAKSKRCGRRVLPLQMDVTHLDQIFAAVDATVLEFGRLDILVNNAGIAPEKKTRARRLGRLPSEGLPTLPTH